MPDLEAMWPTFLLRFYVQRRIGKLGPMRVALHLRQRYPRPVCELLEKLVDRRLVGHVHSERRQAGGSEEQRVDLERHVHVAGELVEELPSLSKDGTFLSPDGRFRVLPVGIERA